MKILNSSAGVVFLSSVLIGGLGKLYVDYKAEVAERAAVSAEKANLISEIQIRADELEPTIEKLAIAEDWYEKSNNIQTTRLESCFAKNPSLLTQNRTASPNDTDVLEENIKQIIHGSTIVFTGHPSYKDTHLRVLLEQLDRLSGDKWSSDKIEFDPKPTVFDETPPTSKYKAHSAGMASLLMDMRNVCQVHLYHQEIMRYIMARSGAYDCVLVSDSDRLLCHPK